MLDEPTSGLDSHAVDELMLQLRKVANDGCACVLSIHQVKARAIARAIKVATADLVDDDAAKCVPACLRLRLSLLEFLGRARMKLCQPAIPIC